MAHNARRVSICIILVQLIFVCGNAHWLRGGDVSLPQGLIEYVSSSSRLQNAIFEYESFSVNAKDRFEKPIGSQPTQFEFGTVQLDFVRRAYKIDKWMRSSPEESFHLRRIIAHVDGLTTIISEDLEIENSRSATLNSSTGLPVRYAASANVFRISA